MKLTLKLMRGGTILGGVFLGVFLFFISTSADGGKVDRYLDDLVVTPPSLLEIIDNFENYQQPIIAGSVLPEVERVQIIIDRILTDEFEINTTDFQYQSKWSLKLGEHFVYAVGFNSLGEHSPISNIINFFVKELDPNAPRISATKIENKKIKEKEEKSDKEVLGIKKENNLLKYFKSVQATSTDSKISIEVLFFLAIILIMAGWVWWSGRSNE